MFYNDQAGPQPNALLERQKNYKFKMKNMREFKNVTAITPVGAMLNFPQNKKETTEIETYDEYFKESLQFSLVSKLKVFKTFKKRRFLTA